MFKEGTEPMEFKKEMMFKNFRKFACALKDFCIQQGFKGRGIKFEKRRVLYGYYVDKCSFIVYAAL